MESTEDRADAWGVRRVEPPKVELTGDAVTRLRVTYSLTGIPHAGWVEEFNHPARYEPGLRRRPPTLFVEPTKGGRFPLTGKVEIEPPDDELEDYLQDVDARIAAANEWFRAEQLPKDLGAERLKLEAAARVAARIAAAQAKLAMLKTSR